jgi:hypothetical protein
MPIVNVDEVRTSGEECQHSGGIAHMIRKTRTDDELRRASDHLSYEMNMLQTLALGMAFGFAGQKSPINNAFLESFGIHARALICFFYAEKPQDDDIIAEDFVSEWRTVRPSITQVLEMARKHANKDIAHLSYDRLKVIPEEKPWDFPSIWNKMGEVVEKFLSAIPERLMGKDLKDYIEQRGADLIFEVDPTHKTTKLMLRRQ